MRYNWKIIGHQVQLETLENEIEKMKLSHAYFFHGPKDIGKFTVAMLFSKILLCPNKLCYQCQSCQAIAHHIHPDFLLIKDEGEAIKIEAVRNLIEKINLTPQGDRRVVLIQNIERMPVEAQNAFLKTLEEPPGETVFLLTASEPKKVLPTILSRVRSYEFNSLSETELKEALTAHGYQGASLDEAVQMSQGKPGLAFRFLENAEFFAYYKNLLYKMENFLQKKNLLAKFNFIEELEKDADQLNYFFDVFALLIRKKSYELRLNPQGQPQLAQLYDLFEKLMETRYLTDRNVNKKLALENLLLMTEA